MIKFHFSPLNYGGDFGFKLHSKFNFNICVFQSLLFNLSHTPLNLTLTPYHTHAA